MKEKKIGLFDLVQMGVGMMIGAGIFSTMGIGIQMSGRALVIAMVVAQLLVLFQQIGYWLLSTVFDVKGGMYALNSLVMPPSFAGTSALVFIVGNFSRGVQGLAIVSYLALLFPVLAEYEVLAAAVIITVIFLVTIPGTGFLAKIQNVLVIIMYAALLIFAVYGVININPEAYAGDPYMPMGFMGVMMASATMSYACNGAAGVINMSDDVEDPKRKIFQSGILIMIVGTILYCLLALAATYCLPYAEVSGQNMGFVAEKFMPKALYTFFVVGGALFALATTMLGGIAAMRWPILRSAQDGWFPPVFTKTTKKGFPWVVMLVMYLVAVVPVICGFSLNTIVSFILVPNAVVMILFTIYCWNIPDKFPKAWADRTFKWITKGVYRICLVISVLSGVALMLFALMSQTTSAIIANIVMTVVLFGYSLIRARSGKVKIETAEIYKEN